MMRRMFMAAWLVVVWLALTSDVSFSGVAVATVLALALLTLFRPTSPTTTTRFRPMHVAGFVVYFLLEFLKANLQVAQAVLQPDLVRDRRAVVAVRIADASETTTTLLAMAVSLTPGTFILDLQRHPAVLFVHMLQFESVRQARLGVLEMERRLVAAFGPAGAAAQVVALMQQEAGAGSADGTGAEGKKEP